MSNLVPYDRPPSRIARAADRSLERLRAEQSLASAREIAKVETIAQVTEAGMLATSHIAAMESLLVARSGSPFVEERLRHIAEAAHVNILDVVIGVSRRFR